MLLLFSSFFHCATTCLQFAFTINVFQIYSECVYNDFELVNVLQTYNQYVSI